ncbi:hypothetical protein JCM15765_01090 [Paradesulfitobacterium aromaticivorans]
MKNKAALSVDEIIRLMVGRDVLEMERSATIVSNEEVLRVDGFTQEPAFRNIDLRLRKGEILGIAGLVGCGRSELVAALGGALRANSDRIILDGKEIKISSPAVALKYGIGFLPSERKAEGLATLLSGMSIGSTMALVSMTVGLVGLGTGNIPLGIIAGLLMGALVGLFFLQPNFGSGSHLEAITAAIIGGISLDGGRGDVLGVLILSIIIDRMRLINLERK